MALTVLIKQEGEDDLALTLDAPRIVIGRAKGCEIQLPDPSVSPRHASIRLQGGRNLVVDEGSTNGIAVGQVRLPPHTPRAVRDGEILRVGRVWLELRFGAGVASTPAEVRAVAMDYLARALRADGEALAPCLEVTEGPDRGQRLELSDGAREYVVGRGRDADLQLGDALCSRRHVAIERDGDRWMARDLGSKQGALLGEEPLGTEPRRLLPGKPLTLGETTLVLVDPLEEAWEEALQGEDVKMKAAEWSEGPPGASAEPLPVVEAPSEEAVVEEPEEDAEEESEVPALVETPAPPMAIGTTTIDLLVVLVALGLIGLSIVGLMYVLG